MSSLTKIPASVGIITLNCAKNLEHALESVKDFSDVYICDGNSTDDTQDVARRAGARVMKQFDTDEPNQRIHSFGETRTRCVNDAREAWYVRVDSDEELSPELVEEIRGIVSDPHPKFFAYKIPRKYTLRGKVIDRCTTYPNFQPRIFHRSVFIEYTKMTHERPVLKLGTAYGFLKHPQLVPLPDTYAEYWKKFESGLRFDEKQHANISLYSWVYGTIHSTLLAVLYTGRLIKAHVLPGTKLPLSYDLARYRYLGKVWWLTTRRFFHV